MKGLVGICAQETSRYTKFWADLENLEAPDGVEIRINYDGGLGAARNAMVQRFLTETDAGWLVMIDDDHAISPEFLRRWLHRHETKLNAPVQYPIVASVYLMRGAPFAPTLYGPPEPGAEGVTDLPLLSLNDFPTTGVVPVYAAGASGMFVRRDVYEAMSPPWYELGQSDNIGEDFWFCVKAQRLGIPVHVDLESRLGHLMPFEVWPDVADGRWATSVRRGRVGMLLDAAETKELTARVPEEALT